MKISKKNERKEKSNIKKNHAYVRLRFLNFSKVYRHFHCASNFLRPNNQLVFHKCFTMAKNFHDNTTKKTIRVSDSLQKLIDLKKLFLR